jgi:hypothetical protein
MRLTFPTQVCEGEPTAPALILPIGPVTSGRLGHV